MNKVRILAVAGLASLAFAGGNLWDFPTLSGLKSADNEPFWGQVHTPGAIYCWGEVTPSKDNGWGTPCFKGTGGWWFGYTGDVPGGTVKDAVSGKDLSNGCEVPVVIEKYIEPAAGGAEGQMTEWIPDALNYPSPGKAGHYLIKGYGLGNATDGFNVNFTNSAGTDEEPTVSAIGFNWRQKQEDPCPPGGALEDYQQIYTENLSVKEGLCIVYKVDKVGVDVELGWNENMYEYNTWIVKLPVATSWKTLDMKWEDFAISYETEEPPFPKETALEQAEALKFSFKNKTASTNTIHFELKEVGWFGTCSGTPERPGPIVPPDPNPITGGKIASAYKFNFNGRMLSTNFAGSVQVINLQGMVVAKKTLAANESMNLSNLPVGIYMVRSEKHGIVQKIMVK